MILISILLIGSVALNAAMIYENNNATKPIVTKAETDQVAGQLWGQMQEFRKANNFSGFAQDGRLCAVASMRIRDLEIGYEDGLKEKLGMTGYAEVAELTATNSTSVEDIMDSWTKKPAMGDPFDPIKGSYTNACVQCDYQGNLAHCVALFGRNEVTGGIF